jgi:hypothetical protein
MQADMNAPKWTNDPRVWRYVHLLLTFLWGAAIMPTVIWWKSSILWVALISCYANMVGHFAAWQASRAEENS